MLETSSHYLFINAFSFWGHLSINCLITLHDNAPPPFSWIFTKYANEWPPRKKIRKCSTRKKDQHEIRTGSDQHEKRSGSGQHEKRTGSGQHKKEPEVTRDLWPQLCDLWLLTLTRKRPHLTTYRNFWNNERWKSVLNTLASWNCFTCRNLFQNGANDMSECLTFETAFCKNAQHFV